MPCLRHLAAMVVCTQAPFELPEQSGDTPGCPGPCSPAARYLEALFGEEPEEGRPATAIHINALGR